jgi:hypothetical protein
MRTTVVVGEPEIEGDVVVLRVAVEDAAETDSGGVFLCRMKDYGTISVESFPAGQTPSSRGEDRVDAAAAAMRFALENRNRFDELFAEISAR